MEPIGWVVLAAIAVGGLFVGGLVLWWTIRATISMAKRILALAFVLGLSALLLVGAGAAFFAAHHH